MDEQLLQKVLACPKLPSLPSVALRVIELTADQNVSLRKLAETIQNDQGLTTKILKTVNSPFYGLAKRCATIAQAQLMLGLNGVKTLALGFSLVTSLKEEAEAGFDYVSYWRRAVYSAVGAKAAARIMRCQNPEEAFLGGLLQDIGMIALYRQLGEAYVEIVQSVGPNHHELGKLELEKFELHHAEVGAMLAERWRLPDTLVAPIRYHEKPGAAPATHAPIVQCVALGGLAAAALTLPDANKWVTQFRRQAAEALSISGDEADDVLRSIGVGAGELASLLSVSTGPQADVQEILESAQDRLVEISLDQVRQAEKSAAENEQLHQEAQSDALTGVASQRRFRQALADTFARIGPSGQPISVAMVDPDCLRRINADHGWEVGDALLIALAHRLQTHFRPYRGLVGRTGADEFGIILERTDRASAAKLLQTFCQQVAASPPEPEACNLPPGTITLTVSVGLATLDAGTVHVFTRVEQLLNAADQALHAAQTAGGNCVRIFTPKQQAAA